MGNLQPPLLGNIQPALTTPEPAARFAGHRFASRPDPVRIAEDFAVSGDPALMTVLHNADHLLPSNVRIEGDRIAAYDKKAPLGTMTHIDYGLNAFNADVFAGIDRDRAVDLAAVNTALVARRGALCDRREPA